jgi:UDP-N-acetylglucosamine/UDP-N-acetylgalactosamine 4-epimerase
MQNNIESFQNQRVLVTGGAGFIGSNLIEKLLAQNNNVVCLDNFITGKKENIADFLTNPNFTLIEGDIRDVETCTNAVTNIDYVFHQAALGSVPRSILDPVTTNAINISGFLNILLASKDAKVKRFIYAASSSTYGDSTKLPKVENEIGKPLSPYAITKYVNELYANVFSDLYGIEVIGLRYFNVFGKKQDPNGAYAAVIPKFIKQLINYESPIINGDGTYSRDFTYVDNVVQINILAALTSNKNAINQVYNVAYGQQTSLTQLVSILKELLIPFDEKIKKLDYKNGPNRTGDIPHSLASILKAKQLLEYKPVFDIKSGLKNAIDWYWKNLK